MLRDIPFCGPWRSSCSRSMLLALLALGAHGCVPPGQPTNQDRYVPPQREMTFDVLFQKNCTGCHGANGSLGPAPPLNDKLFLSLVPDAELLSVVAGGRPGTLMPAFAKSNGGELTDEQVKVLARGIKRRWGPVEPAPRGVPPYGLVQARAQSAKASNKADGLKVFARACAGCHGDRGKGSGHGANSIGAINNPDFLALISDQALRRYVITGRADLGMPDYASSTGRTIDFTPLTPQDVANVTALLASWRENESDAGSGD